MAKKRDDYYRSLNALADYACQTTDLLLATVEQKEVGTVAQNLEKAKQYRKKAEVEGSLIRQKLKTDFITPLEREDIWSIAFAIIDVTEKAEEGLFSYCLLQQQAKLSSRHQELLVELSTACTAGSREVEIGAGELKNHKESATLGRCLSEVKRLRREAEELVRAERQVAAQEARKSGRQCNSGLFEEAANLLLCSIKACETAAMAMELAAIKN